MTVIKRGEIEKIKGMPPEVVPRAFPKLKAAWIMAAPSKSPPGEVRNMETCSGEDKAKSAPAVKHTRITHTQGMCPQAAMANRSMIAVNWTPAPTLPGEKRSQRRPEMKFDMTIHIPMAINTAGTVCNLKPARSVSMGLI